MRTGFVLFSLKRIGILSFLTLLLSSFLPVWILSEDSVESVRLNIGFTRSSFLGVNEIDAKAAFKVFAIRMGERRGYNIVPTIYIFDDLVELKGKVEQGVLELLIIDSWDYLSLSLEQVMPVEFAKIEQGTIMEEYLLLTGFDSEISSFRDLKGKRVVVLNSTNSNSGIYWLRTELLSINVLNPLDFFSRYEVLEKTSKVVLPVFFGNVDACVVDRTGFEIMVEMNPQVGKKLKVVAVSKPFLDSVACVKLEGWESDQHRRDLILALEEMKEDPVGKQIMSLFKFDGLTRFENRFLESIRVLRQKHDQLITGSSMHEME